MRRIVFSKQSDQDLDLSPLWLYWYRSVFKADELIITPVKTKRSSISGTVEFYQREGIRHCYPIQLDDWDDEVVWRTQLQHVQEILEPGEKFIALSADTDQFFEPLPDTWGGRAGEVLLYQRVNVAAEKTPSLKTIQTEPLQAYKTFDLIGGFIDSLENPAIWLTGHVQGLLSELTSQQILFEFHFAFRGLSQFKNKIESLAVENEEKKDALHWKTWRKALDERGDAGLKAEYETLVEETKSYIESSELALRFAEYFVAEKALPQAQEAVLSYPSNIAAVEAKIGVASGEERSFSFNIPWGDSTELKLAFSGGKYRLEDGLRLGKVPTIVDIGAHVGAFTLYIKNLIPEAKVWCFEPWRDEFDLLRRNMRRIPGVEIKRVALGETNEDSPFYLHNIFTAWNSLLPLNNSTQQKDPVRLRHAGEMLQKLGLLEIDILKISTCGSELPIMRALVDLLPRVRVVLVEYFTQKDKTMVELLLSGFVKYAEEEFSAGRGVMRFRNSAI